MPDAVPVAALPINPGFILRQQLTMIKYRTVVTASRLHKPVNPLECRGNYGATSNNMKLVHWPLMGGLLHLVQQGGDWVGP